jgi:hypothetical protein
MAGQHLFLQGQKPFIQRVNIGLGRVSTLRGIPKI